jgi:ABC-type glycerol-3-phosphate transport system permease component
VTRTSRFGSTVTLVIWRWAGFNMLILLTGLQSIPTEIYEAARMDGASPVQAFRRITLALMRPTIALVLCLMVTGSLLGFEQFYILTRGGPGNSTTSVVMVHRPGGLRPVRPGLGRRDVRPGARSPWSAQRTPARLHQKEDLMRRLVMAAPSRDLRSTRSRGAGGRRCAATVPSRRQLPEAGSYGEGVGTYLANTVVLVVLTVAGTLVVATLAGYAFSRFRFPGRGCCSCSSWPS